MGAASDATWKAPRTPEEERQWDQLTNAVEMVKHEDEVLWNIFAIFWGTNAILLVALFAGEGSNSAATNALASTGGLAGVVVSAVGLGLSIMWLTLHRRSLAWLDYYRALVENLEDRLGFKSYPQLAISTEINKQLWKKTIGDWKNWPPARHAMLFCISVSAVLWFLALVYFVRAF
ncbi:MAG: hypothetical protein JSW46_12950 [Gemmatimonadota bacterium]|nr:MAG: hypothetical protein JSW46_12950 [Gemmatimonadota bacterium]